MARYTTVQTLVDSVNAKSRTCKQALTLGKENG